MKLEQDIKQLLNEDILNENRHISHLRSLAKRTRKKGDDWLHYKEGNEHDNKEMQKMYHDDAKDYEKIANHIEKGNHKAAARHMYNMDTAARDRIAHNTYHFIDRHS